jgi:hypothetical protein
MSFFDGLADLFGQMIGQVMGESASERISKVLDSRSVDIRRDRLTRRADLPGYVESSPVSGEPKPPNPE